LQPLRSLRLYDKGGEDPLEDANELSAPMPNELSASNELSAPMPVLKMIASHFFLSSSLVQGFSLTHGSCVQPENNFSAGSIGWAVDATTGCPKIAGDRTRRTILAGVSSTMAVVVRFFFFAMMPNTGNAPATRRQRAGNNPTCPTQRAT